MFRIFGYRYVFDKSAAVIRKAITEPLVETDALKGVSWRVAVRPPDETGVSIVTKPNELRSFTVFLTLDKAHDLAAAVALPPPNAGTEFFSHLAKSENPRRFSLSSWISGDNEEIIPLDEVWRYTISKDAITTVAVREKVESG